MQLQRLPPPLFHFKLNINHNFILDFLEEIHMANCTAGINRVCCNYAVSYGEGKQEVSAVNFGHSIRQN